LLRRKEAIQGDPFGLAFMPSIIIGQYRSALQMITKLFLGIRPEGLLIPGKVIVHEGKQVNASG